MKRVGRIVTWKELENRFREIDDRTPNTYIEVQRQPGEPELLLPRGFDDPHVQGTFETLVELGGNKLEEHEGLLIAPGERVPSRRT